MKVAIPLSANMLSMHFGHPDEFAILEVDPENREIVREERVVPPPHQPGMLPVWLKNLSVNVVITGGMGGRAQMLLSQNGIAVRTSTESRTVENLITALFDNTLDGDAEPCAGGHGGCGE